VIASLNGTTPGGWVRYAKHLADAGAACHRAQLYDSVVDPSVTAADAERRYLELVEEVKAEISVPLAVKLGPWFTAFAHFARQLQTQAPTGWCCSTGCTSPTSTSRRSRWCRVSR
jgi:dihydroorotate dehydrogenase (fumarate)